MKTKRGKKSITLIVVIAVAAVALTSIPTHSWGAPPVRDRDGDGFNSGDDCNDNDASINPGAEEICEDGIDNDCDGTDQSCGGGAPLDSDADGFSDILEQAGISLPPNVYLVCNDCLDASGACVPCSTPGASTVGDGATFLPNCLDPTYSGISRNLCVKPDSPDLMVILARATKIPKKTCTTPTPLFGTSNYPMATDYPDIYTPYDPLDLISSLTNAAGLPIVTHELLETSATDRLIAENQYAIRIYENLDTCAGALGIGNYGPPNGPGYGEAEVYTERIKKEIDELCAEACFEDGCFPVDICQSDTGTSVTMVPGADLSPLYYLYILNVTGHEASHCMKLAPEINLVSFFHFPGASGNMMEQYIGSVAEKVTQGNTTTVTRTLYISTDYHAESIDKFKLK